MPADQRKEILITVHGIRTFGQWQNRLKALVQKENPAIIVETYGYGYFAAPAFVFPPFRWIQVRSFRRHLRDLLRQHGDVSVSIVAHSFGTYIVARGLRGLKTDEIPKVRNVILSGSVLKSNFNWSALFQTGRVQRVVNDCGLNDGILLLSQLFVLFTGMAGRFGFYGFTDDRLLNRYFRGGHSHYFQPTGPDPDAFMRRWWLPLLAHDELAEIHDDRESPGPLQGLKYALMGVADPLKLMAYGGLLLVALDWGVYQPYEERGRIAARDAAELLRSGSVQEAKQKALDILERPGPLIPQSYDVLYNALFNSSIRAKQIDIGSYSLRPFVELGQDGQIIILTDSYGKLSIWSPEGVNNFRHDDLDFKSSSTFAPGASALFFDNNNDVINRFDLVTKAKTRFSSFMLDSDLRPSYRLVALDNTNLIGCSDKKIIAYSVASQRGEDGEENDVTVKWQSPLSIEGYCEIVRLHNQSRLLVGTSEGEIVVFDIQARKVLRTLKAEGLTYIYEVFASDNHVVAGNFSDYVLVGLPQGQHYQFESLGFKPAFSPDGRFLIHGSKPVVGSDNLVILDLSGPKFSKNSLSCLCHFVGFVSSSQFVTLDNKRDLQVRNLPGGEVASHLFSFESDVDDAVFLQEQNLVLGMQQKGVAIWGRPGLKDNGVSYGTLGAFEWLSDAKWLKDDLILLEIQAKRDVITHKLVRQTKTGSDVIWSSRSDEPQRQNDPWYSLVEQALVKQALVKQADLPSLDEVETNENTSKILPGNEFKAKITGDNKIEARQVGDEIILIDKSSKDVVLKMRQSGSLISSFWVGREHWWVAAGSQDGTLRIWDRRVGDTPILSVNAHGAEVETLEANASQSLLLSADRNGRIRVWPLLTKEQLIEEANLRR